jgi:hypothetical protein
MLKGCVIYTIRVNILVIDLRGTDRLQQFYMQFLGVTEVEKPKGNEVVREAIKRLKVSSPV